MIEKEAWVKETDGSLESLRQRALQAVEEASAAIDLLMDAVEEAGRFPKSLAKKRKFFRASGGIGEARAGLEDLAMLTEK